ncbi:hypothetical protein M409DRAFT_69872 [Zasmidium cellare ATCC 36951]|uniref:AMP-dependent synthetase/ligase domain-containing protein n=1 Tax=Zasmidium cellare ATCC 36951 TaxID=1080233 RepID=A0A6A6C2E0_ZASCE|nr:uncharacterized protein M409DRAFT_69872 [Zasmidium cellare ATCC 36951]KAF2161264.1 hypothetical protein M409DRAFT_69872 [Zasmidium cellare ATCC 36951]
MQPEEQLADVDGGALNQERSSIFSHIEEGLKKNPRGLATVVMHQRADHLSELTAGEKDDSPNAQSAIASSNCLQWTYLQLHQAALKFATGLMAHGIQPGMRIATLIPNRVEYPLTLWMYTLLRLTLISLDPGAVTPPRREELTKLMEATNPDVVMVLDEKGAEAIDQVFSARAGPKLKILLDGAADGWTSIPAIAAAGSKSSMSPETIVQQARAADDPDRISLILFTSGTSTGTPKGCARHVAAVNNIFYNIYQWGRGFTTSTRVLTSSPNFRIISPAIHTGIWFKGATAIMPDPSLGAEGAIAAIREWRVNYILFIPAITYGVVGDAEFQGLDVSSVTDITLGGDMITRDIHARTRKAFPHAVVSTSHGMTEGGGLFRWPFFATPFDEIPFYADISPLGLATPGSKLRILDPETHTLLKRNVPGELCVSSKSVINHYLNDTNQDAFLHQDGIQWFLTGDLAMIDAEGIIYILGRIKDVIKRSGVPITPAALESCIEKFTGSQTSVVAWPHAVLGQEPLVVVKGLGGKTEEEVKRRVEEMFGRDYAVGSVVTLEQLGRREFPLNATGKIIKREVVELVEGYYGQRS